ncbi:MAG TPA: hypothetical protein VGF45_23565 [Polyangia bacterium]
MAFGDLLPSGNLGAATIAGALSIENSIKPTTMKRMPPPPAPPLDEYERTVLLRWAKRVMGGGNPSDLCQKSRNARPSARLIEHRKDGNTLIGILEISDADGEPVYGRASVGANNAPVKIGRHEFRIDNASGNSLEVKISDGYDTVTENFDL